MFVHQQTNEEIDRSLRLAEHDVISGADMTLPVKDTRKGTVLGFNATTGNPEAGPTIANVSSLSAITTNINTVAGISSNVTTVAGISSNVTTVAGIASNVTSVAGVASLITSDFVSDLNTLATSDIVSDLNTLATADIVSDLNVLATSDIVSDLNTLATSDIVSDINTLATSDIVSDLNSLATSDFVSDLNAIEAIKANVTTVASNVAGVNSFADRYRVASSDPSSDLDAGDLAFNTSSNLLKFYNGSAWETVTSVTSGISNGNVATFTSGVADDDFLRVSGTSIEGRSASEVASDIGAITVDEATALAIAL
tara:strand:- start:1113 stop:2048 length:936 start_codon:yes stop_codon:yes gene_type:complete